MRIKEKTEFLEETRFLKYQKTLGNTSDEMDAWDDAKDMASAFDVRIRDGTALD